MVLSFYTQIELVSIFMIFSNEGITVDSFCSETNFYSGNSDIYSIDIIGLRYSFTTYYFIFCGILLLLVISDS